MKHRSQQSRCLCPSSTQYTHISLSLSPTCRCACVIAPIPKLYQIHLLPPSPPHLHPHHHYADADVDSEFSSTVRSFLIRRSPPISPSFFFLLSTVHSTLPLSLLCMSPFSWRKRGRRMVQNPSTEREDELLKIHQERERRYSKSIKSLGFLFRVRGGGDVD